MIAMAIAALKTHRMLSLSLQAKTRAIHSKKSIEKRQAGYKKRNWMAREITARRGVTMDSMDGRDNRT